MSFSRAKCRSPEFDLDAVEKGQFPPPRAVQPNVPRPLEAVCLKAMVLRPQDRYGAALELAAEIEHWLADEPVKAWREPTGVRLRRWVRLHARMVTGIGAALVVGVISLAVAAALLTAAERRERQAKDREEAAKLDEREAKDRAAKDRDRARQTLDDMTSEAAEEWLTARTPTPSQRAFLARAADYYDKFATDSGDDLPARGRAADAKLRLGSLLYALGQVQAAVTTLQTGVAAFERLARDAPDNPDYARGLGSCHVVLGYLYWDSARSAAAGAAFRQGLDIRKNLTEKYPTDSRYRLDLASTLRCKAGFCKTCARAIAPNRRFANRWLYWNRLPAISRSSG